MRSEIVPGSFWPHEVPGRDSMAFDLHRNPRALPHGPIDVSAEQWINKPGADRYVVKEDSIRISEDLVLTLLWWENERQILDADEEDEEDDDEEERAPYDFPQRF